MEYGPAQRAVRPQSLGPVLASSAHAQGVAGDIGDDDAVYATLSDGVVQVQFQLRQIGMADGAMGGPVAQRCIACYQRPFHPRVTCVDQ